MVKGKCFWGTSTAQKAAHGDHEPAQILPCHIAGTRKRFLPLLGVRASVAQTNLRFMESHHLQSWTRIGAMNLVAADVRRLHLKNIPLPPFLCPKSSSGLWTVSTSKFGCTLRP